MLPEPICFIDLETTGASFNYDRVIEVGIIRVENGKVVKTLNTLVNPGVTLSLDIELLTGIKSVQLENAPSFYQIKDDVLEILNGAVFAAHNARFDYAFLKYEFKHQDITFSAKCLCTVKLSRKLYPEFPRHNLDALIERFGFKCKNRHRAYDDAAVLWEFYKMAQKKFEATIFLDSIQKVMKRPSLPSKLSEEQLNNLPESPGVYIFYGVNGLPLYIGKSINIRDRVLSHFSADTESQKEMSIAQQIESIETIVTNSELGALLKESELIKKMQPLYNRVLRQKTKILVLVKKQTLFGEYSQVELIQKEAIGADESDSVLAVFKNKKSAKDFLIDVTKNYQLCEKLLGTEKGNGACFAYRLGKCLGACVEKESSLKYNLRFEEAFYNSKIKQWPFAGPILIQDGAGSEKDCFVVDKWCFLGSLNKEDDLSEFKFEEMNFDLDTYKILKRYLLSLKSSKMIKEISYPATNV